MRSSASAALRKRFRTSCISRSGSTSASGSEGSYSVTIRGVPPDSAALLSRTLRRALGGSSGPFYATALLRAARGLPATRRAAVCGLLIAGSAALASRSRRLERQSDGHGAPLLVFGGTLGAVTGLLGALAILAVPYGEPLDGVVDRLQTFTPELADADTLWWLLVPGGALLGLLVATAATKLGWRIVRTGPVSQPGTV